jgi:serine/threonine protein kinase/formylglycine-generating enzyme required for sulfatase activity
LTDNHESERDARLEDLVSRALDLPDDQREAFLVAECGDDTELLDEARSWLEASESADTGFLSPPESTRETPALGESAPGQTLVLGDYEVLEQIGEGGMARVYRGRSRRTGEAAAIKVISAHSGLSERHLERFHRESLNQGRLNHPGIVPVFADGQQGQWHWIAQELVEGHDLERELRLQRRDPMPNDPPSLLPRMGDRERTSKVVETVAQAAEALAHAHRHGVVHRDVKPSNLLLRPSGRVLLADFGLSRDEAMGNLTRTDEIAGSLYYMSPEQARSLKDRVDHRTDIYSLGVVLYELLALRRPFEAGTSVELIKRISESSYRPLRSRAPEVPEALEIIVDRALSRTPEQRFATMAEFAEDLRRFQRGKPIHSRKPTRTRRLKEWAWRNRQWLPAAALIVVLSPLGARGLQHWEDWQSRTLLRVVHAAEERDGGELGQDLRVEDLRIRALRLDPLTDRVVESREPTTVAGGPQRLEPAPYRFEVLAGDQLVGELRRDLRGKPELDLHLPARRAAADLGNMASFGGGTLLLNDGELYENLGLHGLELEIAPFALDRYEVSNADYREFLEATGAREPRYWDDIQPEHDDLPVVGVSFTMARAYAEWRGKRLPTLGEWIWAARGPDARLVPWTSESEWTPRGNISGRMPTRSYILTVEDYFENVAPVDSAPDAATPQGVHHMFGNVFEFTESHPFDRSSGMDSELREVDYARYIAGGSWWIATDPELGNDLRSSLGFTFLEARDHGLADLGFRCARSLR